MPRAAGGVKYFSQKVIDRDSNVPHDSNPLHKILTEGAAMVVTCGECGRTYNFDESSHAGAAVSLRCPSCDAKIRVEVPARAGANPAGDRGGWDIPPVPAKGSLPAELVLALRKAHASSPNLEIADSIKAVLFANAGVSPAQTARLLMTDDGFVQRAWDAARKGGAAAFSERAWISAEGGAPRFDRLCLRLGYGLIPLADAAAGGDLLDRIAAARSSFAARWGFAFGPVRVVDDVTIGAACYAISVGAADAGGWKIEPGMLLAVSSPAVADPLDGEHAPEPAFGLDSVWIEPHREGDAVARGYTVVSPAAAIASHLGAVLTARPHELMGLKEADTVLGTLRAADPATARALESAKGYSPVALLDVMRNLLYEGVPVRDTVAIAEAVARGLASSGDPLDALRAARIALGRTIVDGRVERGILRVTMPPDSIMDEVLADVAPGRRAGDFSLPNVHSLVEELRSCEWPSKTVLATPEARRALALVMKRAFPSGDFIVVAREEVPPDVKVENVNPFYFEDIAVLAPPAIRNIVNRADRNALCTAMKGASDEVRDAVFGALEPDEVEAIEEQMEFMGPVRLSEVEKAQKAVVELIYRMEAEGEAILSEGGEEEELIL